MKAREPDIKVARWVAMLQAADLIEREGHYNFCETVLPTSCADSGCVLGWVAFAAGLNYRHGYGKTPVNRTAEWLGYENQWTFYHQGMDPKDSTLTWRHDHVVAAATLRKLAEEMTA